MGVVALINSQPSSILRYDEGGEVNGSLCFEYSSTGWENDRLDPGKVFERVSLSDLNRICDSTNTDLGRVTRRNSLRYLTKDGYGCGGFRYHRADLLRIYVGQCGYY
ncbi:hypothetical protein ALC56_11924 [Trachymyrmex septentrionalis]|uniref:Uncharacterized protein n=1 Tax=Trachymyrmex septentrionalis TaxID=34720 RepID=A0A195F0I1_9HYME|nr:hypothetical protein ALC56_11924 [Trachymyrmex septentrionalis]